MTARVSGAAPAPAAPRVRAFAPALGDAPRGLVLGTLPGVASLRAGQYYAHPRNAFWPLMGALFGIDATAPYAQRLAALGLRGVALWDLLAEADREGSLDSAIATHGRVVNDVAGLCRRRPTLRVIALNGGAAARLFDRHVGPALRADAVPVEVLRLPSTSPAQAARSFAQKHAAWQAFADAVAACA